MSQSSTAAFTKLNVTLCNKELRVQITVSYESKPGCFSNCEPLNFSLKVPDFYRPRELDFSINTTTDGFRDIFSKELLEGFLFLKLTEAEWKRLVDDYELYLKRSVLIELIS